MLPEIEIQVKEYLDSLVGRNKIGNLKGDDLEKLLETVLKDFVDKDIKIEKAMTYIQEKLGRIQ